MISLNAASVLVLASLCCTVGAYVYVSRREESYVNILTPSFLFDVPAQYILPLLYAAWFGTGASFHAYAYVYATLAVERCVFAYVYTRRPTRPIRLPFAFGYQNFTGLSLASLFLACIVFVPVLLEFREFIFDPRRIYEQTRTGFGLTFFVSSTLAYLAAALILFTKRSRLQKALVLLVCTIVLALHGSKGQVLNLFLLIILFAVYVQNRKFKLLPAITAGFAVSLLILGLFAASLTLGSPLETLTTVSGYSDYTRNAMLVIDSSIPRQYGRLTWESNVIGRIPRALMPNKPKDFGAFYLDSEFFPESLEEDTGAPAFGIGVQYADFGFLAIVYLAVFAAIRGWLGRVCVARLKRIQHPGDLLLVAFFAEIPLIPVGSGWLLPEMLALVLFLRFASCIGARHIYREGLMFRRHFPAQPAGGMEAV